MRKIRLIRPIPIDVLIYDSLGVDYLDGSIPDSCSVSYLEIRESFPIVLRWSFIWNVIRFVVVFQFKLSKSYTFSLIEEFRPKVILTFADTTPLPGEFSQYRLSTLVISVQNALRNDHALKHNIRRAPVYIAYGDSMKELFESRRVPYQRIVTAGSLPLGHYLATGGPIDIRRDLVFISSYRVAYENTNASAGLVGSASKVHKQLFQNVLRYSKEHQRHLTVIAKGKVAKEGEHFSDEKAYLEELGRGYSFKISSTVKDTYKSYMIANSAQVIITVDSTLGYEALGIGKKVLFGWCLDEELKLYGQHHIKYLPEQLLLTDDAYSHFEEKLSALLSCREDRYLKISKKPKLKYMCQSIDCPPHEKIKSEIHQHLAGQF